MDNSNKKRTGLRFSKKKILSALIIIPIFILLMIYFGGAFYYQGRFLPGSYINGIDYSGKTTEDVIDNIKLDIASYSLTIEERGDITERLTATDIGLTYVEDGTIDTLASLQNPYRWIVTLFTGNEYDMEVTTTYDADKLYDSYSKLTCFDENYVKAPVDAYISYDEASNSYVIVPEDNGTTVDKESFYNYVVEAVDNNASSVDIEQCGCYYNASILSDYEPLKTAIDTLNSYIDVTITYTFDDNTEVVDGPLISTWLTIGEDYSINFNSDLVREYVNSLARTYDTFANTRTFTSYLKDTITVTGGDYGWWMNRATETEELIAAIKAGESTSRTPVYYQTANHYGDDDVGNTYIEVDISLQHMWYIEDGNLLVESDFVSGNESTGHGTTRGTFSILYKETDARLVGETYDTPVAYWMPFYDNQGFHDATWRSAFGGDIYMKGGSHGCINLPFEAAQSLFNNIKTHTAVYVYESGRTEMPTEAETTPAQ